MSEIQDEAENLYQIIVQEIISKRSEKGITKAEMARKLGVHPASYGDMEKGKIKFSAKNLFAVMKILDIQGPASEFLSVPDTKEEIKNAIREVLQEMMPEISKGVSESLMKNLLGTLITQQLSAGKDNDNS